MTKFLGGNKQIIQDRQSDSYVHRKLADKYTSQHRTLFPKTLYTVIHGTFHLTWRITPEGCRDVLVVFFPTVERSRKVLRVSFLSLPFVYGYCWCCYCCWYWCYCCYYCRCCYYHLLHLLKNVRERKRECQHITRSFTRYYNRWCACIHLCMTMCIGMCVRVCMLYLQEWVLSMHSTHSVCEDLAILPHALLAPLPNSIEIHSTKHTMLHIREIWCPWCIEKLYW